MQRTKVSLFVIGVLWALTGDPAASARDEAQRFLVHDQAGSTHVSVISVAPWEAYVDALQPDFEMTATRALELALPTTSTEEERFLRALTLAVELAGKSKTSTSTTTLNADGTTTTTGSTTRASGDLSKVTDPELSETGAPALAIDPANANDKDPILRYQAATSIFQEVKLLGRYLKDVAVRTGYKPFLVRLQVTVLPRAHHSPYDTYTTVSFLAGPWKRETENKELERLFETARSDWQGIASQYSLGKQEVPGLESPIVLPVLVTDHVEGRAHSRTDQQLREFVLSFLALSSTGVGGRFGNKVEEVQSLLATDLNGLLTVARLNDSTIRVRLGAAASAVSSHSMVAQTHNVTLVVMVKDEQVACLDQPEGFPLRFVARTHFIDADSGAELPLRGFLSQALQARSILRRFEQRYSIEFKHLGPGAKKRANRAIFAEAIYAAAMNDRERFDRAALRLIELEDWVQVPDDVRGPLIDGLWVEAINSQVGFHWHVGEFEVPRERRSELSSQAAILFDDNEAKASVTLLNGRRLRRDQVRACLVVTGESGSKFSLRPSEIKVSATQDRLDLAFPSLSFWKSKLSPEATGDKSADTKEKAFAPKVELALHLDGTEPAKCRDDPPVAKGCDCAPKAGDKLCDYSDQSFELTYFPKPPPASKPEPVQLALTSSSDILRADRHGKATLSAQVLFGAGMSPPLKGQYFLELKGATLDPAAVTMAPPGCLSLVEETRVAGPCFLTLGIKNLPLQPSPTEPTVTLALKRRVGKEIAEAGLLKWLVVVPK